MKKTTTLQAAGLTIITATLLTASLILLQPIPDGSEESSRNPTTAQTTTPSAKADTETTNTTTK